MRIWKIVLRTGEVVTFGYTSFIFHIIIMSFNIGLDIFREVSNLIKLLVPFLEDFCCDLPHHVLLLLFCLIFFLCVWYWSLKCLVE